MKRFGSVRTYTAGAPPAVGSTISVMFRGREGSFNATIVGLLASQRGRRIALVRLALENGPRHDNFRSRATRLRMQRRADISSIATLLGHTSTRMSERYAHADDAHLHALVAALDGAKIAGPSDTKRDTRPESASGVIG